MLFNHKLGCNPIESIKIRTEPSVEVRFPLVNYDSLCFLDNIAKNPNINAESNTDNDDSENVEAFGKNVKYHFDFVGDKLKSESFA